MARMTEEGLGGTSCAVASAASVRMLGVMLGLAFSGLGANSAHAEQRTISMYHLHTHERITVTYWKDGQFIPSALRKLNWFLRDWRKNKAVRMDPRTIDLIWKLHEDLGSKEPVKIICGHRTAATNAMLRRIGRRVARRSRHITGQAIDFRFPDVPNWKVRNLALAYGIGGVGYYGEGRNGFIHVDTGHVRHWPRLPQYRLASIIRKYRPLIGRGWRRSQRAIMVAFARNNLSRHARAMRAATRTRKVPPRRPIPLPGMKPELLTAASTPAALPRPRSRPYQVLVLAASRMEVTPASAPATVTNLAGQDRMHDPIGMVIASLPENTSGRTADGRRYPRVVRSGKGDLAVALLQGAAKNVPVIDRLGAPAPDGFRAVKGDLLRAGRLGATPQTIARRDGAPYLGHVQAAGFYWPGLRATVPPVRRGERQRVNRAEKGDLLTGSAVAVRLRKAALREGALHAASFAPYTFR